MPTRAGFLLGFLLSSRTPDAASFLSWLLTQSQQRRLSVRADHFLELNEPPPWVSETGPRATRRDPLIETNVL